MPLRCTLENAGHPCSLKPTSLRVWVPILSMDTKLPNGRANEGWGECLLCFCWLSVLHAMYQCNIQSTCECGVALV